MRSSMKHLVKRRTRSGAPSSFVLLAAASVSLSAAAQPAAVSKPDCAHLWERPALLADHELCAHAPGGDAAASRAYMEKANAAVFDAVVGNIPDPALRDRAVQWLHLTPTDHAAVVADPAPTGGWAKRAGTNQAFGGGGLKGGVIMLCLNGKIVRGHYELTRDALNHAGFIGRSGVEFVASAARDPDVYEWNNPSAHGQTDSRASSHDPMAPADPGIWKANYRAWMELNIHRVVDACKANRPIEAGYVLGYVLHGVQDLATHHGITNPEHSYLASEKINPDGVDPVLDVAAGWSFETLQALKPKLRSGCLDDIARLPKDQPAPGVAAQYYGPEDGTLDALWEYRNLGPEYRDALARGRTDLHVEWFDVNNQAARDAFFKQSVLDTISAL